MSGERETPPLEVSASPDRPGENPVLHHHTRRTLYNLIRENWGMCETDLGNLSALGRNNVKYHLQRLVRARLIQACPQGRKVHYFPRGVRMPDLQRAITGSQSGTRREILHLLRTYPHMSWRAISRTVGITPRAVRWHIQQLAQSGLVEIERDGMYSRVRMTPILEAVLAGDIEEVARGLPHILLGPTPPRNGPEPEVVGFVGSAGSPVAP